MHIRQLGKTPLRRLLPRTLPAWVLIILVAVLLASQTALFVIVARDRDSSSEVVDLYRLNERAFSLAKLMSPLDPDARKQIGVEVADSTVAVNLSSLPGVGAASSNETYSELEDIMMARLSRFNVKDARVRLDTPVSADQATQGRDSAPPDAGDVEEDLTAIATDFLSSPRYTVSLQFSDGQWLNFVTPVTPVPPLLTLGSLPTYLAISAFVVLIAFWAVWRIAAPYQLLETAIGRLGDDLNSPPLADKGSRDFKNAARALNNMQSRLQVHVEERELLAAALAHDLRTPVTRMRLRMALVKNSALKTDLERDIGDVEETVQSVIGLAKLDAASDPPERLDFWSMVDAIVDEYDDAVLETARSDIPRLVCRVSSVALRRSIRNLVENAIKYGRRAHLTISCDDDYAVLFVADEGNGIAPTDQGRVFMPFVRLEESRSRETGGSGLGLTIARSLVRKMSGDITLESSEGSGLRVRLTIPRTGS